MVESQISEPFSSASRSRPLSHFNGQLAIYCCQEGSQRPTIVPWLDW